MSTSSAFASALSTRPVLADALREVCEAVRGQLPARPDLAFVFVGGAPTEECDTLSARCESLLGARRLLGCTAESVLGKGREIERSPAVSLWAACLPGAEVHTMHLEFSPAVEGGALVGWPEDLPLEWPADATLLLLGEPFSFPTDLLLARLAEDQPRVPVLGGMASAGQEPGVNRLFLNDATFLEGAVAVLARGAAAPRAVVSQGCRPIGEPLVITRAERNLIHQLGGKPALERLRDVFEKLPARDKRLAQRGVHVGRVVNEYQAEFGLGDFLIRNVTGVDPASGTIAVGDYFRAGQTVQFHVRDHATADEELRRLLAAAAAAPPPTGGALLFTCNGRGSNLFPEPNHDALAVGQTLGDIPLAGMFAMGEVGPVGGKNFVHGFTASLALFAGRGV